LFPDSIYFCGYINERRKEQIVELNWKGEKGYFTGETKRDRRSPICPESTKKPQNAHIMPKKALFCSNPAHPHFTEYIQNPVLWNN